MKHPALSLAVLFSAAIFAGCASGPLGDSKLADLSKKPDASDSSILVEARFLTYAQIQDLGEANPTLNRRLQVLAPAMAYREGETKPNVVALVADAAAFGAKELVNWLGTRIEDEAKKHSAQFAAFVQQPDWWDANQPAFAAIELTRSKVEGFRKDKLFDAIVLIRPVMSAALSKSSIPAAYQLVPVYLLETKPAAKDFGDKMGAVLSIHLECTWISDRGDPVNAVLADYVVTVNEYKLTEPFFFVAKADPGANGASHAEADKPVESSHFFALPAHPATIGVTFGVAEADPSKWVGILEKLGEALGGQAGNAQAAVKNRLNPSS